MKQFILLVIFFIALFSNANSTVYYVSASGNDINNGTSQSTPWQTIAKVNSMMASINAGDQILFKKGDKFYGTVTISKSGAAGNEIVIGSYGSGSLPEISGKKLITGWTLYSGNIYRAAMPDSVCHIYISGKLMTIARYPNSGFLKIDANIGNTGIYDAELYQSSGYWNGANIRVRTANWSYESKTVSGFSGGTITFSSPTLYTTGPNYGYFLDNKLNLLDVQNEWYQDKTAGYVYFYAPGGINPNSLTVEGIVLKNGINVNQNKNFIKVQNLSVNGFADRGIDVFTSNNISVTGCSVTQVTNYGIVINGFNEIINNNFIEDVLNSAVFGIITNGEIKNNIINRTGLYPGYGVNYRGYLGLEIHLSKGVTVENNIIDSTGYSAISVGHSCIVRNNYINFSMLKFNDGAGIDIGDSDTLQVLNNVVLNTIGNTESSAYPELYGSGIYINAGVLKNSTIHGNTCAYNSYAGIYIDHKIGTANNKITGNVLYNNFGMQILFADYSVGTNVPVYNTIVKNNIFYSLQAAQNCMVLRTYTGTSQNDYGDFDSNYYCNPYSEYTIRRTKFNNPWSDLVLSLAIWQNVSNEDPGSKSSMFNFEQYGITDTLSGNMLANSNFTTTISPWISWPSGASVSWTTNPSLDSGCLRMRWNGIGNSIGLSLSNRYSITTGNNYIVSISSSGNHNGTFNLWGLSSLSPTTFTFPQKFFSFDNSRRDYSFTYKAEVTDPLAYMSIGLIMPDSIVYVDNVSMYKVSVEKIDSTQKSKLFLNENNYVQNISLNGINYKDIDGNPVTGNISLQPYSSRILINEGFIPSRNLNLKAFLEGMYNSNTDKMIADTLTVYVRNSSAPFSIIDSCRSVLDSIGNGSFNYFIAYNSVNYYLTVKHRNALETWSASTVSFNGNNLNYDFTTSANKAYGNNLINIGLRYCIYSGDVNIDGSIELSDILQTTNAANNFLTGYFTEDINGDQIADLSDVNIVYNNASKFISRLRP